MGRVVSGKARTLGRVLLGQTPSAKIHVDSAQRLIEWSASNVPYADILVRSPGEAWKLYGGCKPDVGPGEVGTCGGREQPVAWLPAETPLEFKVISIPDKEVLATLSVPLLEAPPKIISGFGAQYPFGAPQRRIGELGLPLFVALAPNLTPPSKSGVRISPDAYPFMGTVVGDWAKVTALQIYNATPGFRLAYTSPSQMVMALKDPSSVTPRQFTEADYFLRRPAAAPAPVAPITTARVPIAPAPIEPTPIAPALIEPAPIAALIEAAPIEPALIEPTPTTLLEPSPAPAHEPMVRDDFTISPAGERVFHDTDAAPAIPIEPTDGFPLWILLVGGVGALYLFSRR